MSSDAERKAFESWIRECEGHPFAGQFANLMWKAWQARAAQQVQADAGAVAIGYINERTAKILAEGSVTCTHISPTKTEFQQVAIFAEAP